MTSRVLCGFISLSSLAASATGCFGDVTLGAFGNDSGVPTQNSQEQDASTDTGKKPSSPEAGVVDSGNTLAKTGWIDRTGASSPEPIPNQDWTSIASDSTGANVVAVSELGDIWTSTNSGVSWTNRTKGTSASGLAWSGVASDSTGTYLVAVARPEGLYTDAGPILTGGGIWTSTDSGVTWIDRTGGISVDSEPWTFVASDSTGTHLVAIGANELWASSNSGATWTNETKGTAASGLRWVSVASDATGHKWVAVDGTVAGNGPGGVVQGDIWTSTDFGVTWTNETASTPLTSHGWVSVASDATGAHLVALANGGGVWGSSDSGHSWTILSANANTANAIWTAAASDATGTHLVAVSTGYDIWVTSDSGLTWANQTAGTSASGRQWSCVASDAAGSHLIAATAGQEIWTNK